MLLLRDPVLISTTAADTLFSLSQASITVSSGQSRTDDDICYFESAACMAVTDILYLQTEPNPP